MVVVGVGVVGVVRVSVMMWMRVSIVDQLWMMTVMMMTVVVVVVW